MGPKKLRPEKILDQKAMLGPKKIWVRKKFGHQKKIWVGKNLGLKKIEGPKLFVVVLVLLVTWTPNPLN